MSTLPAETIEKSVKFLEENYPQGQVFPLENGWAVVAAPLMFHWMVFSVPLEMPLSIIDRYCFQTKTLALTAATQWKDPTQDCPGQWHRHLQTSRRRKWESDGTFVEYIKD